MPTTMTIGFADTVRAALDVLMPRLCPVCGKPLRGHERWLCVRCLDRLPVTHLEDTEFNAMEQLFAGQVPIERATAYFYYEKDAPYAAILHDIKYHSMPGMGRWLASLAARQMAPGGILAEADCIVPVPMHRSKLAKRGYNQSESIAQGLADVLGIPVVEALTATRPHDTQTRKSAHERWVNSQGLYALSGKTNVDGRNVLLVDDVVTTGATLLTCAKALHSAGARVWVFTLAAARLT